MADGLCVLVFGASGMVGQGVLRECLLDDRVTEVRAVVRPGWGGDDGPDQHPGR